MSRTSETLAETVGVDLERQEPPVIWGDPESRVVHLALGPGLPEIVASAEWGYVVATDLEDAVISAQQYDDLVPADG